MTVRAAERLRSAARAGAWPGTTRGAAAGQVQCNVVILPEADASGFERWCDLNPSVAPILARSATPGDPALPALGPVDLRFDLPAYRVFSDGKSVGEVADLSDHWSADLVAFAFGCSFSLEDALRRDGVPLVYEARGFGGAIYASDLATVDAAGYGGAVIVSMRPILADWVEAACRVSERYPQLHGLPVQVGDPAAIGIDLEQPLESLGEVSVAADEVPIFWACGVTTQLAIERARPPRAFTHVSSRMLVTDLRLDDLVVADA